jgi:hypothetical protein
MADGAVNIVAGFIQMDGGNPAFPDEKDVAAKREHIDLYAIIKGANYSIHVSLGVEKNGEWQFSVPTGHEHVAVLGVAREGLWVRIVELTDTVADAPSNGTRTVTIKMTDEAVTEAQITFSPSASNKKAVTPQHPGGGRSSAVPAMSAWVLPVFPWSPPVAPLAAIWISR